MMAMAEGEPQAWTGNNCPPPHCRNFPAGEAGEGISNDGGSGLRCRIFQLEKYLKTHVLGTLSICLTPHRV